MSRVVVRLAPLLHSYTRGAASLPADGATLREALDDLDRRCPGLRFRIIDEQDRVRRHMRILVNETDARDLATALRDGDEVYVVGALYGG